MPLAGCRGSAPARGQGAGPLGSGGCFASKDAVEEFFHPRGIGDVFAVAGEKAKGRERDAPPVVARTLSEIDHERVVLPRREHVSVVLPFRESFRFQLNAGFIMLFFASTARASSLLSQPSSMTVRRAVTSSRTASLTAWSSAESLLARICILTTSEAMSSAPEEGRKTPQRSGKGKERKG